MLSWPSTHKLSTKLACKNRMAGRTEACAYCNGASQQAIPSTCSAVLFMLSTTAWISRCHHPNSHSSQHKIPTRSHATPDSQSATGQSTPVPSPQTHTNPVHIHQLHLLKDAVCNYYGGTNRGQSAFCNAAISNRAILLIGATVPQRCSTVAPSPARMHCVFTSYRPTRQNPNQR